MGWKAVTIRAVAQQLGYTSPLLYEHFRDKQELLTELATGGQAALAKEIVTDLPADPFAPFFRWSNGIGPSCSKTNTFIA
jgi:AcrR family transcriptional regulator